MVKYLKMKQITPFLKHDLPENLINSKKIPKKYKKLIAAKRKLLKRIKKQFISPKNINLRRFLRADKVNKVNKFYSLFDFSFLKKKKNLYSIERIRSHIFKKQYPSKTFSEFLSKLKEKKKCSIFYGYFSRKFFKKVYEKIKNRKERINEKILYEFERRIDVILFRINFCKNIRSARQNIVHGKVLVNGKTVTIPSYQLQSGDVLTFLEKKNLNQIIQNIKNIDEDKSVSILTVSRIKSFCDSLGLNQIDLILYFIFLFKRKYKENDYRIKKQKKKFKKTIYQFKLNRRKKRICRILFYKILLSRWIMKKDPWIEQREWLKSSLPEVFFARYGEFCNKKEYLLLKQIMAKRNFFSVKKDIRKGMRKDVRKRVRKIGPLKVLHLEVSYKLLTTIFLYPPQKVAFPALINFNLLARALTL